MNVKNSNLFFLLFLVLFLSCLLIYKTVALVKIEDEKLFLSKEVNKLKENCETKIALLKIGKDLSSVEDSKRNQNHVKIHSFGVSVLNSERNVLVQMKKELSIEDKEFKLIEKKVKKYQRQVGEIYSKLVRTDGFVEIMSFDYLKRINNLANKTLLEIKQNMTDSQYEMFLEKGYDYKLGLKISLE